MFNITYQNNKVCIDFIKVSKEQWLLDKDMAKQVGFKWDGEHWTINPFIINGTLLDTLRCVDNVFMSPADKEALDSFIKNAPRALQRFEPVTDIEYTSLVKYPPIKGKAPYENYQDEDIKKALSQNIFLFYWEMGLGKSYAASVVYEYLKSKDQVKKLILITSKIGAYNLGSELAKFCNSLSDTSVACFPSAKEFGKDRLLFDRKEICDKDVLVFSYDSWKLLEKSYLKEAGVKSTKRKSKKATATRIPLENFFKDEQNHLLCLDECHKLTNPKSERSKAILKYLKCFKYKYLFSATPIDKNEKLYMLGLLLDPYLIKFMKYDEWINYYNDVGTYFSKYAINKNKWHEDDLDEVRNELSHYSQRRLAADCLELPPLVMVDPVRIDMSEKHLKLYKFVTNEVVKKAMQEGKSIRDSSELIAKAFGVVSTLTENPLVAGQADESKFLTPAAIEACRKFNYVKDYAKLDVCDAVLEEEVDDNEKRGIIWYIHPLTKDVLAERYAKYNPIVIDSNMDEKQRFDAVEAFKKDKKHKIIIASIYILNTSVTITEATFAFYMETGFNYTDYTQSIGRIYRIGQKEQVRVYSCYFNNSTDYFVEAAIERKQTVLDTLLGSSDDVLDKAGIIELFTGVNTRTA